jgi:NAD(P)-dependent dehydrogenase (short-subunit alcohol dehydrogenase family)
MTIHNDSETSTTSGDRRSGDRPRVAFVTGGAQGIGAAIAGRLARSCSTVVVGDLNEAGAEAVSKGLREDFGIDSHAVRLDVTSSDSVRRAAEETVRLCGRVDVLVNNAGISNDGPSLEQSDELWDRTLRVNLTGAFYGAREFAAHMREGGAIVNISSIAALAATQPERHVAYDVSKAGIIALTRTLGVEWADVGIRVNAVAPGYTDTAILRDVGSAQPAVLQQWLSQVPQRRLIDPGDIAEVVAFLASDRAAAITGQLVIADGGWSASA